MRVIPAIDLLDGKCVRLTQGERSKCTIYSTNPLEVIRRFKADGATLVHVVDLNGAFDGTMENFPTIKELAQEIQLQVGGGIRSKERIDALRQIGVNRVIVGTKLQELKAYGVIAGLDFKGEALAVKGWTRTTSVSLPDLLRGVKEAVVTDVARDGMLRGPNLILIKKIQSYGVTVIASGGVSSMADIYALKKLGVSGVIIGKAVYEKQISLQEAIANAD